MHLRNQPFFFDDIQDAIAAVSKFESETLEGWDYKVTKVGGHNRQGSTYVARAGVEGVRTPWLYVSPVA